MDPNVTVADLRPPHARVGVGPSAGRMPFPGWVPVPFTVSAALTARRIVPGLADVIDRGGRVWVGAVDEYHGGDGSRMCTITVEVIDDGGCLIVAHRRPGFPADGFYDDNRMFGDSMIEIIVAACGEAVDRVESTPDTAPPGLPDTTSPRTARPNPAPPSPGQPASDQERTSAVLTSPTLDPAMPTPATPAVVGASITEPGDHASDGVGGYRPDGWTR